MNVPTSSPLRRVLGAVDPRSLGSPFAEIGTYGTCRSAAEVRSTFRSEVEVEVAAMLALIEDADAFDVIELMRMREFPPVPDPRVVVADGSGVVVEIVAAMLLGRPSRQPSNVDRLETRPHEQVSQLHQRAHRLVRLASYRNQMEALFSDDPLASLAARYRSAVMSIRNMQYDRIRDAHESRLFKHPIADELMQEYLGYRYPDVVHVRDAMTEIGGERLTTLRNETGDIMMRHRGVPPQDIPEAEGQAFMERMIPFMFLPADRAIITAEDIARRSGVTLNVASAVLDSYAQKFDPTKTPATRVIEVLAGENPFLTTPLITDGSGGFVATATDLGCDSLRRIFEQSLPTNSAAVRRYDQKARQKVSEGLALEHLTTILGSPPAHSSFDYFAPRRREQPGALGSTCPDPTEVGNLVEGDGLFLIGDVAICVEVKAKSVAPQARRGDVTRLSRDLNATIGTGSAQAGRLQELIETNGGLWRQGGAWLDLTAVQEVRSIVVLLDDVGPLGTDLGDLVTASVVPTERPAWVVSLHDLATIAEVSFCPGEFLLYLRRRTDSDVRWRYRAVDELDLYMLFFDGGLYIAPDPDETRAAHPTMPPVRNRDRREHERDDVATMVTNHCQTLDAWMQRHNIEQHNERAAKPQFTVHPGLAPLIDLLNRTQPPGWLRGTADMLSMAGKAQAALADGIKQTARKTRRDGQFHDGFKALAGAWGHPTFFFAARPAGADRSEARDRLLTYMTAKRHQLGSDRAYAMLFDHRGSLEYTAYLNAPLEDDADLDQLVEAMGLRPVGDAALPPLPPSARRRTRRLRGKARK